MSEQEVERFVERLKRIWSPQVSDVARHTTRDGMLWVHGQILEGRGRFSFCRNLGDGSERVFLAHYSAQNSEDGRLDWNSPSRTLTFHSYFYNGEDINGREGSFVEFANEWMPFFRRGCWLSTASLCVVAVHRSTGEGDFLSKAATKSITSSTGREEAR